MDFSVLNESSLHNTLKKLYAFQNNGQTEVHKDGHVYDILTEENLIIEIQTKNLAALLPKLNDSLAKGYKIKIVHPVILKKTIILNDKNNNIISKHTSPKKGSIYDILRELTGIYPLLLKENFTLEIPLINMTEFREQTDEPVQSKNKKRRFPKNWIKTGKKLDEITDTRNFNSKTDYLSLLPENLNEEFCAKDINLLLKQNKTLPASASKTGNLLIWILLRMKLIEETKIEGKTHFYKKMS